MSSIVEKSEEKHTYVPVPGVHNSDRSSILMMAMNEQERQAYLEYQRRVAQSGSQQRSQPQTNSAMSLYSSVSSVKGSVIRGQTADLDEPDRSVRVSYPDGA